MQELTKEEQLLINCARVKMPPDLARETEALYAQGLDWDRILNLSDKHGITPLLYHSLRGLNLNGHIDPNVMSRLREAYYANAVRNLKLYEQLKEILTAFNEAGIETIVLKGAALAETVYGNIALRTMGDIDLLVHKEDLGRAHSAMKQLGYSNGSEERNQWFFKHHHHLSPYSHQDRPLCVEVHHHVFQSSHDFHITPEELFSRCVKEKIGSVETLVLSPTDLLLHVCMHAATEGAKNIRIIQLRDMDEIISAKSIDWNEVIKRSHQWEIAKSVYTCLYLVQRLLKNTKITLEVLKDFKMISNSLERWLTGQYKRDLFESHYSMFNQIFWIEGWSNRIKMLFKKARVNISRRFIPDHRHN